jgi:2-oxoglutarate dehydrogenase E1 component
MMQAFNQNSYLFGGNAPYVEELYEAYLNNPASVSDTWRAYFETMQLVPATDGNTDTRDQAHAPIIESFAQRAKNNAFVSRGNAIDESYATKQAHVQGIIAAYRFLGSRFADLDPLHRTELPNDQSIRFCC